MKHRHCEMIVAKANNMDLVIFVKNGVIKGWGESDFQEMVNSQNCEFYLCLPQHKEPCLHWLNGGNVRVLSIKNSFGPHNSKESGISGIEWRSPDYEFEIKPIKEKRWIGVKPDGFILPEHRKTKESIEAYAASTMCGEYQFIEIEVEV